MPKLAFSTEIFLTILPRACLRGRFGEQAEDRWALNHVRLGLIMHPRAWGVSRDPLIPSSTLLETGFNPPAERRDVWETFRKVGEILDFV
jgi:hypothetical protein